jgi:prenyl protein peptidase
MKRTTVEHEFSNLSQSFLPLFTCAFSLRLAGHFIAPVVAHAFCNHMGFPAFREVMAHPNTDTRHKLIASFVIGLVMWMALLYPITSPFLYSNDIYDS